MKINGTEIAQRLYEDLKKGVEELPVTPHLVVILIGDDPASKVYIAQKQKWGEYIGAKVTVMKFLADTTTDFLVSTIKQLNEDDTVHGIIVQRPLPEHIDKQKISLAIGPKKDIDGFRPGSQFGVPVALAVLKILQTISSSSDPEPVEGESRSDSPDDTESSRFADKLAHSNNKFLEWLQSKTIVSLGKGETAGGPIIALLKQNGLTVQVVDSKTKNPDDIIRNADIVISSVGKPGIINSSNIKHGVTLIGVGITKDGDGALHGDYDESDIQDIAAFYTPTPGGIGPINVAFLLQNLVAAAKNTL